MICWVKNKNMKTFILFLGYTFVGFMVASFGQPMIKNDHFNWIFLILVLGIDAFYTFVIENYYKKN